MEKNRLNIVIFYKFRSILPSVTPPLCANPPTDGKYVETRCEIELLFCQQKQTTNLHCAERNNAVT